MRIGDSRTVLGKPARESESLVHEIEEDLAVSRVPRGKGEKDPGRGAKENLKPCAYKQSKAVNG